MSIRRPHRIAIGVALAVQLAGLLFDIVWHALHPGFEAVTVREMVTHLSTVHLPIYLGALGVLVTTARGLADQRRRRRRGFALPVAFMGAIVSVAGEAWHASTHLQLSTHGGPLAALTSFVGFLVVVAALVLSRRLEQRRAAAHVDQQRAA